VDRVPGVHIYTKQPSLSDAGRNWVILQWSVEVETPSGDLRASYDPCRHICTCQAGTTKQPKPFIRRQHKAAKPSKCTPKHMGNYLHGKLAACIQALPMLGGCSAAAAAPLLLAATTTAAAAAATATAAAVPFGDAALAGAA
jgi:hypothetical protein